MKSNESSYDNLRVSIRVRPPLNRETQEGIPFRSIAIVSEDHKSISLAEYVGAEFSEIERQRQWIEEPSLFHLHRFTFDAIFDMDSLQEDVYNISAKQAVQSVLEGYNSTIFCYGQTGTGKTYTMEGFTYESKNPNRGIIQRTIQDIFNFIETTSDENTKFIIRASFLQIYNENISDLLKSDKKNLQIREDKKKGIYVDLLSEWAVRSPLDLYALLRRGGGTRSTSSTYMNDVSSRSHAVFQITVEQMTTDMELKEGNKAQIKVGKLNLVDLAGSERIRITGTRGQQLEESKKINKSLSCLGNVINALTDKKGKNYIPYRDSKLTRLLQDSLGGNCKTTMIATISPSEDAFSESLSTLYFAQRAKKIKNRPIINEDVNNRALIRKYEKENSFLKNFGEYCNENATNVNIIGTLMEYNEFEELQSMCVEEKKKEKIEENNDYINIFQKIPLKERIKIKKEKAKKLLENKTQRKNIQEESKENNIEKNSISNNSQENISGYISNNNEQINNEKYENQINSQKLQYKPEEEKNSEGTINKNTMIQERKAQNNRYDILKNILNRKGTNSLILNILYKIILNNDEKPYHIIKFFKDIISLENAAKEKIEVISDKKLAKKEDKKEQKVQNIEKNKTGNKKPQMKKNNQIQKGNKGLVHSQIKKHNEKIKSSNPKSSTTQKINNIGTSMNPVISNVTNDRGKLKNPNFFIYFFFIHCLK